jgi:hypothetical protein
MVPRHSTITHLGVFTLTHLGSTRNRPIITAGLKTTFLTDYDDPTLRLSAPLGSWQRIPIRWTWCFSRDCLYCRSSATAIWIYRPYRSGHRTRVPNFILATAVASLPPEAIPTMILGTCTIVRHTGTAPLLQLAPAPVPTNDWWGSVVHRPTNILALIRGILAGTAVCITDGSYGTLLT